jgi:hypothetical protein
LYLWIDDIPGGSLLYWVLERHDKPNQGNSVHAFPTEPSQTNGEIKMDTYEVENIARQRMDSLRDEAAFERLVQGCSVEKSSTLSQILGPAFTLLVFIGLIALNL